MNLKPILIISAVTSVSCVAVWFIGWYFYDAWMLYEKFVNTQYQTLLLGIIGAIALSTFGFSTYHFLGKKPPLNDSKTLSVDEEETKLIEKIPKKTEEEKRIEKIQESIEGRNGIAAFQSAGCPENNFADPIAPAQIDAPVTDSKPKTVDEENESTNKELSIALKKNFIRQLNRDAVLVRPATEQIQKWGLTGFDIKLEKPENKTTNTEATTEAELTPADLNGVPT